MRVLQVSNLVSHHQLPLAREIVRTVGEANFRFVATATPDAERARLGWSDQVGEAWILRAGEDLKDRQSFEQWWDVADVIICGERRFDRMQDRAARGQYNFYASERWWKPPTGMFRMLSPGFLRMARKFCEVAANPCFHYLAIGPYAASDISRIADFTGRTWQWGYFTEVPFVTPDVAARDGALKILWVGRMLGWKRVDTLIRALTILLSRGLDFELTLIGDGPERKELEALSARCIPGRCVFLDFVPAPEVPEVMNAHHVYVLPSSAYEGWGAVANEAMAYGCALVASRATGAAAAMIEDKVNGLLFDPDDWRGLGERLSELANNEVFRLKMARHAQGTMRIWSPKEAAHRFLSVSEALLSKNAVPEYAFGPMKNAHNEN